MYNRVTSVGQVVVRGMASTIDAAERDARECLGKDGDWEISIYGVTALRPMVFYFGPLRMELGWLSTSSDLGC